MSVLVSALATIEYVFEVKLNLWLPQAATGEIDVVNTRNLCFKL
jgi:hypothetical protein